MGLFSSIVKLGVSVVKTPVAIVKDTVTLGGVITDEEPATPKAIKKVIKNIL